MKVCRQGVLADHEAVAIERRALGRVDVACERTASTRCERGGKTHTGPVQAPCVEAGGPMAAFAVKDFSAVSTAGAARASRKASPTDISVLPGWFAAGVAAWARRCKTTGATMS